MKIALFGKTIAPENGEYMQQLFQKLSETIDAYIPRFPGRWFFQIGRWFSCFRIVLETR